MVPCCHVQCGACAASVEAAWHTVGAAAGDGVRARCVAGGDDGGVVSRAGTHCAACDASSPCRSAVTLVIKCHACHLGYAGSESACVSVACARTWCCPPLRPCRALLRTLASHVDAGSARRKIAAPRRLRHMIHRHQEQRSDSLVLCVACVCIVCVFVILCKLLLLFTLATTNSVTQTPLMYTHTLSHTDGVSCRTRTHCALHGSSSPVALRFCAVMSLCRRVTRAATTSAAMAPAVSNPSRATSPL